MRSEFPLLLVDDGELDDVRDLLNEMGADFAHLRGGAVPARVPPPRDLFIATGRRAPLARDWPPHVGGPGRPVKIAIVTEDSGTARSMLRRMGFDFLVRRPVHPVALRLLIVRALYRGEEKRRDPRVAVGYEVGVRAGLRRRSALLADLSARGCRLLVERRLAPGTRLTLQIPAAFTQGKELILRGRVLRSEPERGSPDRFGVAVGFDKLDVHSRERLLQILRERALGPAVLPARAPEPKRERIFPRTPKRRRESETNERRRHRRGRYARSVVALSGEARQVILGRDLSIEGMRVEPSPDLGLGKRVRLALYGGAREEPFLIDATVARDDGEEGLALRFERVDPAVAAHLEQLVAGLPAVEALHHGETGALGTILSRIVSR